MIVCGKGRESKMRREKVEELVGLIEMVLDEMSGKGEECMDLRWKKEWNMWSEVRKVLRDKLEGRRK